MSEREVVQVGWDGASQPMYRYADELELAEHERTALHSFHATVLLNREEDEHGRLAIFARSASAYRDGDRLEAVYTYQFFAESRDAALARVWSDFNRGSPSFVGDTWYPQRSLSMGDVVELNGVGFTPVAVGWEEVGT